ncbi:DUF3630 family protein [Shewanella sp. WXL01]|uniref:DUF3630 family protein n=1 Tax=Shewanella maritima TaxID=2520507 RepID=A0A411PIV8_9GAMM|nr:MULTISPECIES: DUF3630 family protein [Shewanella]NKF52218.1 DUF3630 family protein [Shewanella sp. WXL01]QBF83475.1 DUF3630 family protein [Shewanella maritima]
MLTIHALKLDTDSQSLILEADVDFDRFEQFAEPLAKALDCQILQRQWGADRHQWRLDFESCALTLEYEFYGNVCWLKAEREQDFEVVSYLASLLQPYLLEMKA